MAKKEDKKQEKSKGVKKPLTPAKAKTKAVIASEPVVIEPETIEPVVIEQNEPKTRTDITTTSNFLTSSDVTIELVDDENPKNDDLPAPVEAQPVNSINVVENIGLKVEKSEYKEPMVRVRANANKRCYHGDRYFELRQGEITLIPEGLKRKLMKSGGLSPL